MTQAADEPSLSAPERAVLEACAAGGRRRSDFDGLDRFALGLLHARGWLEIAEADGDALLGTYCITPEGRAALARVKAHAPDPTPGATALFGTPSARILRGQPFADMGQSSRVQAAAHAEQTAELHRLREQVREMERLLGRKTVEIEQLRDALAAAQRDRGRIEIPSARAQAPAATAFPGDGTGGFGQAHRS